MTQCWVNIFCRNCFIALLFTCSYVNYSKPFSPRRAVFSARHCRNLCGHGRAGDRPHLVHAAVVCVCAGSLSGDDSRQFAPRFAPGAGGAAGGVGGIFSLAGVGAVYLATAGAVDGGRFGGDRAAVDGGGGDRQSLARNQPETCHAVSPQGRSHRRRPGRAIAKNEATPLTVRFQSSPLLELCF